MVFVGYKQYCWNMANHIPDSKLYNLYEVASYWSSFLILIKINDIDYKDSVCEMCDLCIL